MNKNLYFTALVTSTFLMLINCYGETKDYPEQLAQLHKNVISHIFESPVNMGEIGTLAGKLKDNGSWPDIDYTSQERGGWETAAHLSRILAILKAYYTPGSEYYKVKNISVKMHQALNFWLENDFICPNWWYPEIGVPRILNPIMLLMESELSEKQIEDGLKILHRSKLGRTGQNKVWQAGNVLLTALFQRDLQMVKRAAEDIQSELIVSMGEGVQPDWSYHQHGPMQQFGNYGLAYISDMIQWISILKGTPFSFDESKISVLRNYLLEGQQWVIWKERYDISSCGRQVFSGAQVSKAASLLRGFEMMVKIDPDYAVQYQKALDYQTLTGNKHFWRSDYHIHRTTDYFFSVKMSSERVIGAETVNTENIQGYYMGDGAAFIYQTTGEYDNIFPFWDWRLIPGVTAQHDTLRKLTAGGPRNQSKFVGGVSDGKNGIAVLDYIRNGLKARKSWFMFDDMIVCLGAGITSTVGSLVTTSVNQSYYHDKLLIAKDMKWILHDYIGYFFPGQQQITLKTDTVEGGWNEVTSRMSSERLKAPLFKLWLDHGIDPENKSYSYIIVPNAAEATVKKMLKKEPFILVNEKTRQEVISASGETAGIVFYEPGKSEVFGGIEADQACLLMLKSERGKIQLNVADPTQLLSAVTIILNGAFKGENAEIKNGKTSVKVLLPSAWEAGKTVTVFLDKP